MSPRDKKHSKDNSKAKRDTTANFARVLRHHIRNYDKLSPRNREIAALELINAWRRPNS
jgi:hypothetical protein